MKLIQLLEGTTAYHGTNSEFDEFDPVGRGVNYGGLGQEENVDRHGIFFSLSPEFAQKYGKVGVYDLNISNVVDIDEQIEVTDKFVSYLNSINSDLTNDASYIHNYGPKWEFFDGELGNLFSQWITAAGYDAVRFDEEGNIVIVVFDPSKITKGK